MFTTESFCNQEIFPEDHVPNGEHFLEDAHVNTWRREKLKESMHRPDQNTKDGMQPFC